MTLSAVKCLVRFYRPQVRISSWPKEIPGSWFSEFKRGKIVSLPIVPSLLTFSVVPPAHSLAKLLRGFCIHTFNKARAQKY